MRKKQKDKRKKGDSGCADFLFALAFILVATVAIGAPILLWSELFEADAGTVVEKEYSGPSSHYMPAAAPGAAGFYRSSGERYSFEIVDGRKAATVSVPGYIWAQAEVGDWYDKKTATLVKADERARESDSEEREGAGMADG